MSRYSLSPAAQSDLRAIREYIAGDRPQAAFRTLQKLREAFNRLADYPGLGRSRPEWAAAPIRFYAIEGFTIIYRPGAQVEILRVAGKGRDIEGLLS
ncbi:MAG TPA: type II toxin-antitoxin system RelE/ParE family toxin [Oscillatoriaceae cyanobacterium]